MMRKVESTLRKIEDNGAFSVWEIVSYKYVHTCKMYFEYLKKIVLIFICFIRFVTCVIMKMCKLLYLEMKSFIILINKNVL